jgi:hypothetical protein
MNKLKLMLPAILCLGLLASCNDTDDLEKRLDHVEDALGTNEPLRVDFATTNYDDVAVESERVYRLKPSGDNEYIYDNQDGTYYVYIERFGNVDWEEGAWMEFTYDSETKTVTEGAVGTYFNDFYGSYKNVRFYQESVGNTLEIDVNSFNPETGKISVDAIGSSTTDYPNNIFEGKPMNISLAFRGVLNVYLND